MSLREKDDVHSLINEKIPYAKMQLISHDGKNLGEVTKSEAVDMARATGLDLVIITEKGAMGLPVAKVMDFGKAMYAKKKQQADAKKSQKIIRIKEIQIRPKIGEHDFKTKINAGIKFLLEGKRLKITLVFKGREVAMKNEHGTELFAKIHAVFDQAGISKRLVQEKDSKTPQLWTKIYYLK